VTAEQARVANDYIVDLEVRHFEASLADGKLPEAHVMIIGRLIRVADRKLVATVMSEARERATEDRMGAVAAAFESAAQKVSLDLAKQTATVVADDQPNLKKVRGESG
jgi:cholesterol transport system auxiliary component